MKRWRSWNLAIHRDLGYFFSSLTIVYCLSGVALNHVDAWNPDFIIEKREVRMPAAEGASMRPDAAALASMDAAVGEARHRVVDYPTPDQVKLYYENGSLHVNLRTGGGVYEKVRRRPIFYEANLLHRNSISGWKWASDVFGIALTLINLTGLLILRGRYGFGGRGKWLVLAGALPPAAVLVMQALSA
jgi:hypothetical protein